MYLVHHRETGMKRFIAIGLGGMAVLMFSGSQVVFFSSVDTEPIQQSDFIADWFVYRVMVYSAILLIWPVSVRFITSDEIVSGKTEATERKKRDEQEERPAFPDIAMVENCLVARCL